MNDEDNAGCASVLLFIGAVLLVSFIWLISSYQEAKAFNRQTGSHATTWDAMWTELRVMGEAKKE